MIGWGNIFSPFPEDVCGRKVYLCIDYFIQHGMEIINTVELWNSTLELHGRMLALSFYRQILLRIVESFSVQINER